MANSKNNTALATLDTFTVANKYDGLDPELIEELKEQMEDQDDSGILCNVVKIPSGGGIAYEVQMGGDPNEVQAKTEIVGAVVFTHRMNAYWEQEYGSGSDDSSQLPACSSMDGKTGVLAETGELRSCETCPFNQYGTDTKGGRGKACKNMRRIYIIADKDPTPYLMTVPPTSIKDVNTQLTHILAAGVPYTKMILACKLTKAKNANNVSYSKVTVERVGTLPDATAAKIAAFRREIKTQYSSMAITLEDYVTVDDTAKPQEEAPAPQPQQPANQSAQDADFAEAEPLPFK